MRSDFPSLVFYALATLFLGVGAFGALPGVSIALLALGIGNPDNGTIGRVLAAAIGLLDVAGFAFFALAAIAALRAPADADK